MEDIINDLMKKIQLQRQQDLIDDIIDIYHGVYKNYDEYVRLKKTLFEDLKRHDFFTPEFAIMDEDIFEYIKNKG